MVQLHLLTSFSPVLHWIKGSNKKWLDHFWSQDGITVGDLSFVLDLFQIYSFLNLPLPWLWWGRACIISLSARIFVPFILQKFSSRLLHVLMEGSISCLVDARDVVLIKRLQFCNPQTKGDPMMSLFAPYIYPGIRNLDEMKKKLVIGRHHLQPLVDRGAADLRLGLAWLLLLPELELGNLFQFFDEVWKELERSD